MRLLHYSAKPFKFTRRHVYTRAGSGKPMGFWVSVEGEHDWPDWCGSEMPESLGAHVYEVALRPTANVLRITSLCDLGDFNHRYGAPGISERHGAIDWAKVAKDYDGVIIAPYQWTVRMSCAYFWYYTWDCASGVIWYLDAIEAVRELEGAVV